jgi:hypothetical protein
MAASERDLPQGARFRPALISHGAGPFPRSDINMVSRSEPGSVAIDPDDRPSVPSEPLLARFLMRELESSDGINDLLALLDAPQQSLARWLAVRTADNAY